MHSNDKHKLIIMNHRDQKSFNVAIMNYKNSSTYVQRQIDCILRKHRKYIKTYVNDIIIFFKILKKHFHHLIKIFDTLNVNNIIIKPKKLFLIIQLCNYLIKKLTYLISSQRKTSLKSLSNCVSLKVFNN